MKKSQYYVSEDGLMNCTECYLSEFPLGIASPTFYTYPIPGYCTECGDGIYNGSDHGADIVTATASK